MHLIIVTLNNENKNITYQEFYDTQTIPLLYLFS